MGSTLLCNIKRDGSIWNFSLYVRILASLTLTVTGLMKCVPHVVHGIKRVEQVIGLNFDDTADVGDNKRLIT